MGVLRVCWNIIPIIFTIAALTFTLLVLIAGTNSNNQLADIYFMRINTTDIIPSSVPNSGTYNSIAESLGLHDFYQNSLWGYCEGYNSNSSHPTNCSKPTPMYSFNPVEIFSSELLAGQNVTIPQSIQDNLNRVRTASHWMFALYLVAAILLFITLLVGLTALCTLFGSVISTVVAFLAGLFITAATLLAQIMFIIYRNVINNTITQLNVDANLGTAMFAFSWTAVICSLIAFIGFLFGICCGTGDRQGRYRRGWRSEKYSNGPAAEPVGY